MKTFVPSLLFAVLFTGGTLLFAAPDDWAEGTPGREDERQPHLLQPRGSARLAQPRRGLARRRRCAAGKEAFRRRRRRRKKSGGRVGRDGTRATGSPERSATRASCCGTRKRRATSLFHSREADEAENRPQLVLDGERQAGHRSRPSPTRILDTLHVSRAGEQPDI